MSGGAQTWLSANRERADPGIDREQRASDRGERQGGFEGRGGGREGLFLRGGTTRFVETLDKAIMDEIVARVESAVDPEIPERLMRRRAVQA